MNKIKNCNTISKFLLSIVISISISFIEFSVFSAPLSQMLVTLEQPNGAEIECFANGDEFFNYFCDELGNIIVQDELTGYYVYGELYNGEIVPSENIVTTPNGSPLGGGSSNNTKITFEDIPEEYLTNIYENSSILNSKNIQLLSIQPFSDSYNPGTFSDKTVNNIVIFVRFNDTPFSTSSFNTYNGYFNTNATSLKNYYSQASYNNVQINSVFCPTPTGSNANIIYYTDTMNRSYYTASAYREEREYELIKKVVDWANNNNMIPTDMNFDANNNGQIDAVTIIAAGNVQTGDNQILWPHAWDLYSLRYYVNEKTKQWPEPLYINGKEVYKYSLNMEGVLSGSAIGNPYQTYASSLSHETFHMVFDAPDLYYGWRTPTVNHAAVGAWDIMCSSNGGFMNTYSRFRYGQWISIPEVKTTGRYTLNPVTNENNSSFFVRSPYSSHEYFLFEYRQKGNSGTFEYNIPNSGLVVYRINDGYNGNNYSGTNYWQPITSGTQLEEVWVYRNNPTTNTNNWNTVNNELNSAYFANSTATIDLKSRGSATATSSAVGNGSNVGIRLSNVSAAGATISFNLEITTPTQYGFRDIRVATAIANQFGKTPATLTSTDLANLTSLSLYKSNWWEIPFDLTGLEQCTNLMSLSASDCGIEDISPLSNLNKLVTLDLTNNNITSVSALNNKTSLRTLKLRGNLISDYLSLQNIYGSLTTKDFSLSNKDDIVFRIPNYSIDGLIGTAYAELSATRPIFLYVLYEKYNANGTLIASEKNAVYLSGNRTAFNVPNSINCEDGAYVIISGYERKDYRQQISKIIIKPNVFDLSQFN